MKSEDIIKKVRKIEIKTRGLSNDIFAGKYHSAFKGRGMSFSEVREYRPGDDVRDIEWNVTARSNKAHIKVFEEERELTMMLLIDISGSSGFGTKSELKRETIAEIAAVLAFSAAGNNDKVGCMLFTDHVEKYIPPKKGRQHVLRILSDILEPRPTSNGTNISECLRTFTGIQKKKCTAFVISDLMDIDSGNTRFEESLKIAAGKHDIVALRVFDEREIELPSVGLVNMYDMESGKTMLVDTSSSEVRRKWAEYYISSLASIEQTLLKSRVDKADFPTGQDYVSTLIQLFKRR